MSKQRPAAAAYWFVVSICLVIGVVGIFSIGAPFLLIGIILVALAPFRRRATVFWPVLAAGVFFIAGYVLVTPLSCTASASISDATAGGEAIEHSMTRCTNLLGIDYSGTGLYNPPLWPAFSAGLVTAALGCIATRVGQIGRDPK